MSDEIFPRVGICRDKNYESTQASADWKMLQIAQLPPSMWDATTQNLGTVCNAKATLVHIASLPWLMPLTLSENFESQLPPTSELFGSSLNFDPPVSGLNISTVSGVPESKSHTCSEFYVTFSGHFFDVKAMAFEFYEDKMEFENYDLVISMPEQESILTTASWEFFLDRIFPAAPSVDEHDWVSEFQFIEEKLEFEENDLAMSFPGQESILDADNVGLLCSKLMEWNAGEKNTDDKLCHETRMAQICSLEGYETTNIWEDITCNVGIKSTNPDLLTFGNESTMERTSSCKNMAGLRIKKDDERPQAVEATGETAVQVVPVDVRLVASDETEDNSDNALVTTGECAFGVNKALSLDVADGEESWKTKDEPTNETGIPAAVGNTLPTDSRALPGDATLVLNETVETRTISRQSAVERPRETSPYNIVDGEKREEMTLESDLAGRGIRSTQVQVEPLTTECGSVSRKVTTEGRELDSTRVKTNVKRRKNIFAGCVCAKIVKVFVKKFLLI